jgi:Flp pilus assembly protein TadD
VPNRTYRLLTQRLRILWTRLGAFTTLAMQFLWRSVPRYLPFYVLIAIVILALYHGRRQKTVISAFHLPPENKKMPIPFSGETVANTLQDALRAIHMEAEGQDPPPPCTQPAARRKKLIGATKSLTTFADLKTPAFEGRGGVETEINGVSVAALASLAREILGRETTISGDVLAYDPGKFELVARASHAGPWADEGPWTVDPQPLTPEGLRTASCKLAEQVWESANKNLLAAALIHRGESENYEQVIRLYDVIPTDPRDRVDALNNLGIALRETGKIDDSIVKFKQALALKPDSPEEHYNLGYALAKMKDYQGAKEQLGIAIALKPDFSEPHNVLGALLAMQDDYEGAKAEYRKAISLRSDYPQAYYNLGLALEHGGQHGEAISSFRRSLAFAPDRAQTHYSLGNALEKAGQHEEATVECNAALKSAPEIIQFFPCAGIPKP